MREKLVQLTRDSARDKAWLDPIEKQSDFADAFHRSNVQALRGDRRDHKVFIITGGNRSGKSFCATYMCMAEYLVDHAPPEAIIWCVAPTNGKSIELQQRELWAALPRWMFGRFHYDYRTGFAGETVVLDEKSAQNPNGRNIVVNFKSESQWERDPKAFEAVPVNGVWIDESISEVAFDALVPRTIDRNGFILISCIPDAEWMHERFEHATSNQRVKYTKIRMADNHHLGAAEIEDSIANMSEEERQVRYYGNFAYLSGLVYKEFNKSYAPEGHLCRPFDVPRDWPHYFGADWGNDSPTAALLCAVAPNGTLFVIQEFYQKHRAVKDIVPVFKAMVDGRRLAHPPIIDSAAFHVNQSNCSSIGMEFIRHGFEFVPSMRTSQYGLDAQVQQVKHRLLAKGPLGPALQVFDTCENLVAEFKRWRYRRDRFNRQIASDMYEKKNDHALDALRYVIAFNPQYTVEAAQVLATDVE